MKTFEERLWARIDKDAPGGCWLWRGALTSDGYGAIWKDGGTARVHRVTYELLAGQIPEGKHLDHLCRVRSCCNPDHLESVTPYENWRRGENFAAVMLREDECGRGHAMTEDNTYRFGDGQRRCRACYIVADRARSKRRRAATA